MLSPIEAADLNRGQLLKRSVRAAAALHDLYDDVAIAREVGVGRATVGHWWTGAKPSGRTLFRLAEVTGLSAPELTQFLYNDGPLPALPTVGPDDEERAEGERRADAAAQALQGPEGDVSRARRPAPPSTTGSGR